MPHHEPRLDAALRDIQQKVADHGWAVVGVFPTQNDPADSVPFSYTVGLTEAGLPELFVNGLPHETAQYILNQVARTSLARQVELADGNHLQASEVELSVDLRVAACADSRHLRVAHTLYGPERVECLQVLWPDAQGRWPNDPAFTGNQPLGPAD